MIHTVKLICDHIFFFGVEICRRSSSQSEMKPNFNEPKQISESVYVVIWLSFTFAGKFQV